LLQKNDKALYCFPHPFLARPKREKPENRLSRIYGDKQNLLFIGYGVWGVVCGVWCVVCGGEKVTMITIYPTKSGDPSGIT
jgi:hypothetical protein